MPWSYAGRTKSLRTSSVLLLGYWKAQSFFTTTFGITTNPTLQTTLVRARDASGVVVTTSSGTTVLQSSEDGDLVVPHDLQCTGEVVASGLRATSFTHNGTLLSTQLDSKENEFDVTSPLQKVLDTEGFIGLRIDQGADLEVTDLHLRGNLALDGSKPSAFFRAGRVNSNATVATMPVGMFSLWIDPLGPLPDGIK